MVCSREGREFKKHSASEKLKHTTHERRYLCGQKPEEELLSRVRNQRCQSKPQRFLDSSGLQPKENMCVALEVQSKAESNGDPGKCQESGEKTDAGQVGRRRRHRYCELRE